MSSSSTASARTLSFSLIGAALLALLAVPQGAAAAGKDAATAGNFDARVNGKRNLNAVLAQTAAVPLRPPTPAELTARVQVMRRGLDELRRTAPGASARFSTFTGAPEIVSGDKGPLSAAAPGRAGIDIVRDFLHTNRALYGLTGAEIDALRFIGESVSPKSGLRMVRVEQRIGGLLVFQSETRFVLDRQGRIWRSLGLLVPTGAAALPPATAFSAPQALAQAMKAVGITLDPSRMQTAGTNSEGTVTRVVTTDERIAGDVQSDLVYFPAAPGRLVPAWRQIVFTATDKDYYSLVDAGTGTVIWRKNIRQSVSTQPASFSVYVQADGETPADSPAPASPNAAAPGAGTQFPAISRTTVNMLAVQDIVASPDGWIPDGGTTTTGNNVDACVDRVGGAGEVNVCDIGTLDNNGRPIGNGALSRDFVGNSPRDFTYTPAPLVANPDAGDTPTGTGAVQVNFRRGATTQLFYITNWYHDQLFQLGFDEAAGNFQNVNFSGMGVGGDRVAADVQDSSGTNNANFATPPDGMSGRMQMFRFTGPNPDRDGDLDAEIVVHELTHGTSNRLIGNGAGLNWSPGGGMGEGWSDFYALSLLNGTNADDPNGKYATGAYATYQLGGLTDNYVYGIRRFPYSTDNTVNPLTWADVDDVTDNMAGGIPPSPLGFEFNGALEVHNVGEVWALTLWEVRSRIIADPAGANGDVPTGNATMLQIVTDGMKLTPMEPSFTDARDALILADCAANACANERSIWDGFADRGLGYDAVSPLGFAGNFNFGNIGVGESFSLPFLDVAGTAVNDSLGNGNGFVDPGEPIQLTVSLLNPWRNAGKNVPSAAATLTSSTAGVTIVDGTSVYPAIAAQGTANGDTFLFTVAPSALCGQSLKFTITTVSSLGTHAVDFTLRVGEATGLGAPVTLTKTVAPALVIPDGDSQGVFDTFNVTNDLEIADLDFRVDSLAHTFTGDLTIMLRAPNGYGTDLIWLREAVLGGGDGDNFINTVIDDESVNDLNQSFAADAPFTGDWLPAFNSPFWPDFIGIPEDPVGQLSRLDGTSTEGNWTFFVADQFNLDGGQLNAWSLIVTPRAFTCEGFTPAPVVTGTKTVAGTFQVGGTVTYTVTLTNNGAGAQPDNAGNELTDVLPATLTLVSANATSGTASTAGNTVSWNGSLAALGGSVTITITATVNPSAAGQTVSNQGTISYDADANGSNEASGVTDDPGTAAANDPTSFGVAGAAVVTGTKTVSGTPTEGGTLTYTVVLSNSGTGAQADNPGNEFTDVLPASVTLVSANATSGAATTAGNTVNWNGSIAAGGSVTITITATVNAGTAGQTVSNQGSISYDSNGDGTNDAAGVTDNPGTQAPGDPTTIVIGGAGIVDVPTLSEVGLAALILTLAGAALFLMRRRRIA
ncbi:MAG TPA: M36 family metallopeptidase [Thermoanaerobaculia bacterium]|nr:M36 family metallopeptidase [Thermoanaerobaculia bacterium]